MHTGLPDARKDELEVSANVSVGKIIIYLAACVT